MHVRKAVMAVFLFLAVLPLAAQDQTPKTYQIRLVELDQQGHFAHITTRQRDGKPSLYVTLRFKILKKDDDSPVVDIARDVIVVEEDGRRVTDLEIDQPAHEPLTVVLAVDTSGSM